MPIYVEDRKIKIVTGKKSQTINVYVNNDEEGVYNPKLRITNPRKFITEDLLKAQDFRSIDEMVSYLKDHHDAIHEDLSHVDPQKYRLLNREILSKDETWADTVVSKVDLAINSLVDDFLKHPYRHRVEHSLHCELYMKLAQFEEFNQLLDFGSFRTSTIHKEWPETIRRPSKGNRRGNFDLAILSPKTIDSDPIDIFHFRLGLIEPAVAIELGLDYGLAHLKGDVEKLENSKVKHGYLVHFARPEGEPQDEVEDCVLEIIEKEKAGGPKIAYVNINTNQKRFRKIGELEIKAEKRL
jgi:hypothetical protein